MRLVRLRAVLDFVRSTQSIDKNAYPPPTHTHNPRQPKRYAFNIIFNIINKTTLNAFPCPWLISTLQLGARVCWCGYGAGGRAGGGKGDVKRDPLCSPLFAHPLQPLQKHEHTHATAASGLFMAVLWVTKLQPAPKFDRGFLLALAPVALFHTIGHVSACVSFSQVAVSFAHVVKAAEPVFSVILSAPLLGVAYPWYVWGSLLPIVAGCSLSAMKEVSFSWAGFNNAMVSNLGMVLRNIYSKKSLVEYKVRQCVWWCFGSGSVGCSAL
jgi:solute carrier family 35 protein E1